MNKQEKNTFSIISLVVGIFALLISCCYGGILGIVGVVLGVIALKKQQNKTVAIIGIIVSALAVFITIIMLIFSADIISDYKNADNNSERKEISATTEDSTKVSEETTEDLTSETEETTESSVKEKENEISAIKLGEDIGIESVTDDCKGNVYSFIASYWSTTANKDEYIFYYYEEGHEYPYNFYITDETDEKILSYLQDKSYKDNEVAVITACYDGVDDLSRNYEVVYYMFTIESIEKIDKNPIEELVKDKRYKVGDTIEFTSGLTVYINDVGLFNDDMYDFVYVDVEITNVGNEELVFGNSSVSFYGDGYNIRADSTYSPISLKEMNNVVIAPGRKAAGICCTMCDNYDSYSIVEAQIGDAVILIKDNNMYPDTYESNSSYLEDDY